MADRPYGWLYNLPPLALTPPDFAKWNYAPSKVILADMFRQEYSAMFNQDSLNNRLERKPIMTLWQEEGARVGLITQVQELTAHQKVSCWGAWQPQWSMFAARLVCKGCEKTWRLETTEAQLRALRQEYGELGWKEGWVRGYLFPFYESVASEPCYGAREAALLAEWITKRVAAAGQRGLPYVQVVHEGTEARLVPPKDVDWMLRKMKFVEEWVTLANSGLILPGGWDGEWTLPILSLPLGHPLRSW